MACWVMMAVRMNRVKKVAVARRVKVGVTCKLAAHGHRRSVLRHGSSICTQPVSTPALLVVCAADEACRHVPA
jgi:hypothetical protein